MGGFVFGQGRVVEIQNIATHYTAMSLTVTFEAFWTTQLNSAERHLDTAWIFVDYAPINNNVVGRLRPAAITDAAVTITTGSSNIVDPPGITNARGFFLNGHGAVPFRATVAVTLSPDLGGTKFNGCIYATDYPPNATIGAGVYDLHGTPPFVVNGDTPGDGVRTYTGCINNLTDFHRLPGDRSFLKSPPSQASPPRPIPYASAIASRPSVLHRTATTEEGRGRRPPTPT
ncbi:MAG: hypothetical protein LBD91_04415 [Prevotellaceae bacterium]|jgi:hypothetical protein|nr:hypothetical protein [Prevotellaceae bacterium]